MVVGDLACGKSCLISNFLHNTFTENYEPTDMDIYNGRLSINEQQVDVEFHDTSGADNLAQNRKVIYESADVFMICIATHDENSLRNVDKWKSEIRSVNQKAPFYLILTKSDTDGPVDLKKLK